MYNDKETERDDHHEHHHDHHEHYPEYFEGMYHMTTCPWISSCPMAHSCPMGYGHEKMSDDDDYRGEQSDQMSREYFPYHRPPYFHHHHYPYYYPYYSPYYSPYYYPYYPYFPSRPPFYGPREESEQNNL